MPQIHFAADNATPVEPTYSDAVGPVYRTGTVEVAQIHFKAGEGARPHHHPEEQAVVLLQGRMRVRLGDETFEAGPGDAWHVPSDVEHEVRCLQDVVGVSFKRLG